MADQEHNIDRLRKERDYYRRMSEELAATTLQQDYTLSTLRHQLKQKRQSLSILTELQQFISLRTPLPSIFEMTVRSISSTLSMDKTVVLGPTERKDCFRPLHWHGFESTVSARMGEMELWLPWRDGAHEQDLLVTASTKSTPLVASIKSAFELSYFACVPIETEQEFIGLLVAGRMIENRPYHARLSGEDVDALRTIVSLITKAVQNQEMAALKTENERKELELQKAAELEKAYRALEETNRQLRNVQAELQAQAEQLHEFDEQKSRFFANISHEFRTPLTLIIGPLEDAIEGRYGRLPEPLEQAHQSMLSSSRRLLRLVGQLLDLSKLEHGKMQLHRRQDNLAAFIQEMVRRFAPLAERRKIRLCFSCGAGALTAPFDADKLEKAVANLLSNALKFTPEGGKVGVKVQEETAEEERWAEIIVRDTGPGIAPADIDHIFEPFQQGTGTRTSLQEGTGLGLSLARQLVELHGGEIEVDSEEGFGTTFTVRLPMDVSIDERESSDGSASALREELSLLEEAEEDRREPVVARGGDGQSEPKEGDEVLLLVEDNAEVRAFLRRHLEGTYRILEAANGAEALAMAREQEPDLMISDVMMPEMNGFELLEAIKADDCLRAMPIILLTARADPEHAAQALDKGADDYLTKPFSIKELQSRVRRALQTRRSLRRRYSSELIIAPSDVAVSKEEKPFVQEVLETVEAHLADSTFGTSRLAETLGMSRRHMTRRVKEVTGETPGDLLRRMRMDRAAQLLRQSTNNVSEIARTVGFNSPSHFSKSFQAHFGASPTAFREDGT